MHRLIAGQLLDIIVRVFLKFRDHWNLSFPFTRKLVAEQRLAGAIVVVFFCHMEPFVYSKEQVLLYAGSEQ
ncbi:hypothetical protein CLOSTMETH_00288 [[Clostridium] methylpentosum DSM 5476]|uniref:Uncharacterized protein n=1 Tax=[Clostridium] methylpentosum DSM 5476 TaxID=537013 RepID=C0E8Z3_9FIRM|nr:hypothetical protein CLOSTMETH_00288 [[Clostridium] methylpentosum DSM 5476]